MSLAKQKHVTQSFSGQTIYRRGATGPFSPSVDPSEKQLVYRTKAYEQFYFAPENRPIYDKHVQNLKQSILENGYMKEVPIQLVRAPDGKGFIVTDGQHRLAACKALGVEVYYQVREFESESAKSAAIRVVNAYSKAWRDEDYLAHFCMLGNPHYKRLQSFMSEFDLGISSAISILSGANNAHSAKSGTLTRHAYRVGNLQFTKAAEEKARITMSLVNSIRNYHERLIPMRRQAAFVTALIIMVTSEHYDEDRMLANMDKNLMRFVFCTNVLDYLALFTEVFNWKRKSNRIVFTRTGSKKLFDEVTEA